jgi:antitoxin component YwqK of YwqJK toxin-antitoxin module
MPIMNITFRKIEQIMKILTILAIITSTISVSTSTYATENNLVKDIIIDSQVFYYYGTSRKKSTTEYNNNLPTSTTGYYRSGKRSYLKTFTGPNITSYKTWFESGTLRSESFYNEGEIQKNRMYYQTGSLDFIAYYTDGKMIKEETYFDDEKLESEVFYENNTIMEETRYYNSGSIKQTTKSNQNNLMERISYDRNGNQQSVFLLPTPFPIDQLDSIVNRDGNLVTFYESGGIESITKITYSKSTKIQPEDSYFKTPANPIAEQEVITPTLNYLVVDPLRPTSPPISRDNFPKQQIDAPMRDFYKSQLGLEAKIKPAATPEITPTKENAGQSEMRIEFYESGGKKSETEYFRGEPYKKIDYDEYGLIVDIYTSFTKEDGWVK